MKFAIYGYGAIGKTHHRAIDTIPQAQLTAIIDNQTVDIDDVLYFTDFQSFAQSSTDTDVIIIATPNGLHFEHAMQAIDAGFHVLIEKPAVLSTEDFSKLMQFATEKNVRAFNMLQLRFSPLVKWIKELITSNSLGKIYLVNAACYWNRNREYYQGKAWHGTQKWDGGVLFTQFSHFVDVLHYWLGDLQSIAHESSNFTHTDCTDFDDSGILTFRSEDTLGSIVYTTSCLQKNFESHITLIAEKGTIKISGQYMNELSHQFLADESMKFPDTSSFTNFMHPSALSEVITALNKNQHSILDMENSANAIAFLEKVQSPSKKTVPEL
ncbi:MAG: Gfo/Idh/MocA family oxidoreductase [Weeksellaceae bacterium]|nr:Gfo/Idh/MocA family oxidoreductase [Weeksellaceae bacterium]